MTDTKIVHVAMAVALAVSCWALSKALTENIIISKFATVREIVQSVYGPSDFDADNPQAEASAYENLLATIDWGFNQIIGLSERVRANYQQMTSAQGYTVAAGARQLWAAGDRVPALLIFGFSIIFPILKTLLMLVVYVGRLAWPAEQRGRRILKLLNASHKYTMLDVFVVAVMVFALSNQKLISVNPGSAIYWYVLYMAASYLALWGLERDTASGDSSKHI